MGGPRYVRYGLVSLLGSVRLGRAGSWRRNWPGPRGAAIIRWMCPSFPVHGRPVVQGVSACFGCSVRARSGPLVALSAVLLLAVTSVEGRTAPSQASPSRPGPGVGADGATAARGSERGRVLRLARGAVKVLVEPRPRAAVRGFVSGPGAALELHESRRAPGCRQLWHRIGESAWVCDGRLKPGEGRPEGVLHPALRPGRSTPSLYLVNQRTQKELQRPSAGSPGVRTLRQGSGFVVRPVVAGEGGPYRPTRLGFLPAASMRMVRPSGLEGVSLSGSVSLPVSWVSGATAWVHSQPSRATAHRVGGLKAYSQVTVEETRKVGRTTFVRVGPHRWVLGDLVRTARKRTRPPGVDEGARWIHVSLRAWTLVAYQGDSPVYAALISRGFNTPRGKFTITKKAAVRTLRFESRAGEVEMEAVPWVMYFKPRFAFHTAYWHDGFGARASHGCINLSPADARWLFDWTTPTLPPGWHEMSVLSSDPVTHVLIE